MQMTRRLFAMLCATAALACASSSQAQSLTSIRFTLDWKLQGQHAVFFIARDKGYFKDEGLEVTIDQGEGSSATISRIMSGAYDAGFGDINTIIEQASQKPGQAPVMVYQFHYRTPFVVVVPAAGPVKKLSDLEGKTLGAPAGSAAARLFPVLARSNHIDPAKVQVSNMAPSLQEQMLVQGRIDGVMTYNTTTYMNLLALKRDPDKDFRWLNYGDFGLDLYANGVMVSQKLLKENPKAVRGLVSAINRALKDNAANVDDALKLMAKVEPLLDGAVEKRRTLYVFNNVFASPETDDIGFGDIRDERLTRGIAAVTDAFGLARKPAVAEVFQRAYLPPKADRQIRFPSH